MARERIEFISDNAESIADEYVSMMYHHCPAHRGRTYLGEGGDMVVSCLYHTSTPS